jgi:hypothetical protein
MQNLLLTKYWLTFDKESAYPLGIGVTAFDTQDAENLVAQNLFGGSLIPAFQLRIIASLNELESNHVLPNIGPITFRGIWYPNL